MAYADTIVRLNEYRQQIAESRAKMRLVQEQSVSAFRREGGVVSRVSNADLGPGDDFCSLWHFLDLLPARADGWRARFDFT